MNKKINQLVKIISKLSSHKQTEISDSDVILIINEVCNALDSNTIPKIKEERAIGLFYSSNFVNWKGIRIKIVVEKYFDIQTVYNEVIEELNEISIECITLFFLPDISFSTTLQKNLPSNIIFISPSDLIAIFSFKCSLSELIDYKFYRLFYIQKNPYESEYDQNLFESFKESVATGSNFFQSLNEVLANKQISTKDWVDHPLCDRIHSTLEKNEIQILIGASSSGKSTLAFQVGWRELINSKKVKYINVGQVSDVQALLFSEVLLEFQGENASLIIIDDTQANPNISRYICQILNTVNKASFNFYSRFLIITWPDYAEELLTNIKNAKGIHVHAEQVRNSIVNNFLSDSNIELHNEFINQFGSDLFLLIESLKYFIGNKRMPSNYDLASFFWEGWQLIGLEKIQNDARRAILITSALGRFDIPVNINLLSQASFVEIPVIEEIVHLQIFRKVIGKLTLGHRSFATLIGDWLKDQNIWQEIENLGGTRDVPEMLHYYLRSLTPQRTIDALRVLQNQSGFKGNKKLSYRSAALVELWQTFDSVLERILHQQYIDPTWSKIPSSVMFAIESLSSIGKIETILPSINFLRSLWVIEKDGNIKIDITGLPTIEDFEKISESMAKEDENHQLLNKSEKWVPAHEINISDMHKNWLLGVFLTAEASFDRNSLQIQHLIKYALSNSIANSGAYYPERVPWVTARVLLGLSSAGITSSYSPEIRKTVDWLLKERSKGGAMSNGIWESGTGIWNTEIETTSMCLLALIRSGVNPGDERLSNAKRLLYASKYKWTNHSTILDGALAIEAFLASGGGWDEVVNEVKQISMLTKTESFWESTNKYSKETFSQSCRAAQIASNLINIGWLAVRSDLPLLVNSFVSPKIEIGKIENVKTGELALSINQEISNVNYVFKSLLEVSSIKINSLSVIGNYLRYNEKIRNKLKDWCNRIKAPLFSKSNVHENFLIWAPPGSGKSFLIQELARSLSTSISYFEINLAIMKREDILSSFSLVKNESKPVLCLIDEIDARSDENWPYEDIFPYLDLNINSKNLIVFVLIGSSRDGVEGLSSSIQSRTKGKDLIDRIPDDHRFSIPPLDKMDKMTLVLVQISLASANRGNKITSIEKFALYYIITNDKLHSPRQLRDISIAAVQRVPAGETRLRYVDIFDRNDKTVHRFWHENETIVDSLSEVFVNIE
jgi:DNA replication protein DnaC